MPEIYTSINWITKSREISRAFSKNECFTTSSMNFTMKDERTSGTVETDFDTTVDKNVIGRVSNG